MFTRIMTAVLGIPLVILGLTIGNPYLKYGMLVISWIALFELFRVIKKAHKPIEWIGYSGIGIYYVFFEYLQHFEMVYMATVGILLLGCMVIKFPKYSLVDVALTFFAVLYTGVLFSYIVLVRNLVSGQFWVWLIAISSWGSDTCAYFTGISLGKHKMAPILSPKKTIEGSIGGVLGAGIIGWIYAVIYLKFQNPILEKDIIWVVVAVMIGAAISQVGDLAASAIKRQFNQKDYGTILPGHGGILDRFDSILFVAPVIYVTISLAQHFMG